ncbi:hypothetical protein QTG54_009230 [Skeletonema marinoi]|uniref:Uncharacterized protein n=1 Tax=Skeletonema marinoi TaxID=267567 RepID=A0AAD9DC44_9STRA|nr:hypothetical protein QTG54_009230 [Skeletonema marinoi]
MEEVLQNPKATWEEIRLAMKSHGHATNGGAMTTLLFPVTTKEGTSKETGQKGRVVETAAKPGAEGDDNAGSLHHGQLDELLSNNTPMNSDFGYKPCRSRKPATIAPKAGRVGSANSINRAVVTSSSTSITTDLDNASLASVDMMDFGVDNDVVAYSMDRLNEIDERRRESKCSVTTDDSTYSTDGFLDWNHDDGSSACPSHAESSPGKQEQDDTHNNDHERAARFDDPPAPEVRHKIWHFEEHDFEPEIQQPVIPKMFKRLSSGTMNTVSSLISNLALELEPGPCTPPKEATTDEVKKALSRSISFYRVDGRRASC